MRSYESFCSIEVYFEEVKNGQAACYDRYRRIVKVCAGINESLVLEKKVISSGETIVSK